MSQDLLKKEQAISKEPLMEDVFTKETSSLKKYQNVVVGHFSLGAFLKFELMTMVFGLIPGGFGLYLRKLCYPSLFKKVGSGLTLGRNITFRHPGKIEMGDRVVIDDNCLIDAKGAGEQGIIIGNDVLIARGHYFTVQNGSYWHWKSV